VVALQPATETTDMIVAPKLIRWPASVPGIRAIKFGFSPWRGLKVARSFLAVFGHPASVRPLQVRVLISEIVSSP
jgi:hypothetical protein